MKKFLVIALAMLFLVSVFPAYAVETANDTEVAATDKVAVFLETTMADKLYYGEIAKVHCDIMNPFGGMGAQVRLYLDGVLLAGTGSEYFVLGDQNKENFDFLVPATLDVQFQHTLLVELICENGQALYSAQIFTVTAKPAVTMGLYSVPQGVHQGYELYFGVRFSLPAGKVFKLSGTGYVRGVEIAGSKQELIIYNGMQLVVCVPVSMNMTDPSDFVFTYTLRSEEFETIAPISIEYDVKKMTEELIALKKIEAVVIPATVLCNTTGYAYASLSGYVTDVPSGTVVEYLNPDNSHSMKSAKVKLPSGTLCWVPMSAISISKTNYTIQDILTNAEKEAFVNEMGYDSKTNYMVWVNKQRQILVLFTGSQGDWHVSKVYPVATGKNSTPTPTRVCEYQYKTRWVTETYICEPVLSLFEAYAIHNQPVSHSGYVIDRTIGNPASAGCIRMLKQDVDELYSIIPIGTRVVLY